MKRRTFIREIVLLSAAPLLWLPRKSIAQPGWNPSDLSELQPPAIVAGGCATQREQNTGTTVDSLDVGNSLTQYVGCKFTASASYTACAATLRLHKINSPTTNFKVCIYSDSSGPSALVGSASDAVSATTIPSSEGDVQFVNLSAALTSGTVYYMVLFNTGAADGTNRPRWNYIAGAANQTYRDGDGAGAWTVYSSVACKFTLFSA